MVSLLLVADDMILSRGCAFHLCAGYGSGVLALIPLGHGPVHTSPSKYSPRNTRGYARRPCLTHSTRAFQSYGSSPQGDILACQGPKMGSHESPFWIYSRITAASNSTFRE
eukprot:2849397-Amphidinium_carterae.1